ncbi:hypothetical protein SynA1825c_01145 [Synechococcus sp. A18-25c]|nr:hypothetical protein SynA1825c_01145 [Synechococcus sp. A18-25c]
MKTPLVLRRATADMGVADAFSSDKEGLMLHRWDADSHRTWSTCW